jgi:hypothetical protein
LKISISPNLKMVICLWAWFPKIKKSKKDWRLRKKPSLNRPLILREPKENLQLLLPRRPPPKKRLKVRMPLLKLRLPPLKKKGYDLRLRRKKKKG